MPGVQPSSASRIVGWIGWAGLDAIGRLVLLSAATVIFSRLLDPADFGVSAIILAIAAAAGLMVGAPFEDALAQRRTLRAEHLRSALGFGLVIAIVLIALSVPAGPWIARIFDAPAMALLLPVTMLSIFFSGHGDLVTARARRRQRFNVISAANLFSHVAAVPVALVAAFLGAGVWSFIILRLVQVVVRSLWMQFAVGYPLRPQLSIEHLADLRRFASFSFFDRLTDNLTYLVFNNLVALFFGLSVLGHVNMAMRLVEPARGAIVATMHNLIFPHFRRLAHGEATAAERDMPIALLAFMIAAVFAGLAALMPVLLPLVSGPGWETAIVIAMCLAWGSAFLLPARPIYTSLSADARPEFSLFSSIIGLALTSVLLIALRDSQPAAVGAARLAGDAAQALFAIFVPLRHLSWTAGERLRLLLPAWLIAFGMFLAASAVLYLLHSYNPLVALAAAIFAGVIAQVVLMALFQRWALRQLLAIVRPASENKT